MGGGGGAGVMLVYVMKSTLRRIVRRFFASPLPDVARNLLNVVLQALFDKAEFPSNRRIFFFRDSNVNRQAGLLAQPV